MKGNRGGQRCTGIARRLLGNPRKRNLALFFSFFAFFAMFMLIDRRGRLLFLEDTTESYLRSTSIPVATNDEMCDFYLAESAIPHGGLGVFTSHPLTKGAPTQAWPDICVYLTDAKKLKGTEITTHTWQDYRFGAQWLGGRREVRAACMGLVTIFNSMGMKEFASARPSADASLIHTNGGLDRSKDPGAGAITQYYGATSVAIRDMVAGSELMLWDSGHGGDQYESPRKDGSSELDIEKVPAPIRPPEWLQKHGMCADNIVVQTATDSSMGRGAFAKRFLAKGKVIAPAPLQIFPNRAKFNAPPTHDEQEKSLNIKYEDDQLFVNYSLQPKGSSLLLFPYGPGVGLINHASKKSGKINGVLKWSNHHMNHGTQWLDASFSLDLFWKMQYPGSLILDVVALRDIAAGEEIFIDYGDEWETAWEKHVQSWKPSRTDYVYPLDEMSRHNNPIKPFRTAKEQKSKPYASNLMTVCDTRNHGENRKERMKWQQSERWPEKLLDCIVESRTYNKDTKTYSYEVQLWPNDTYNSSEDGRPLKYIDYDVPHSAIRFVDKPFESDQHIPSAFRHPIGFPEELTPPFWKNAIA